MKIENSNIVSQIRKFNRHDLIIFLIPITIFSIYLAVFNPGMATIDSFNQLHQIASGQFTTGILSFTHSLKCCVLRYIQAQYL